MRVTAARAAAVASALAVRRAARGMIIMLRSLQRGLRLHPWILSVVKNYRKYPWLARARMFGPVLGLFVPAAPSRPSGALPRGCVLAHSGRTRYMAAGARLVNGTPTSMTPARDAATPMV